MVKITKRYKQHKKAAKANETAFMQASALYRFLADIAENDKCSFIVALEYSSAKLTEVFSFGRDGICGATHRGETVYYSTPDERIMSFAKLIASHNKKFGHEPENVTITYEIGYRKFDEEKIKMADINRWIKCHAI